VALHAHRVINFCMPEDYMMSVVICQH